jgi:hypothetical protein
LGPLLLGLDPDRHRDPGVEVETRRVWHERVVRHAILKERQAVDAPHPGGRAEDVAVVPLDRAVHQHDAAVLLHVPASHQADRGRYPDGGFAHLGGVALAGRRAAQFAHPLDRARRVGRERRDLEEGEGAVINAHLVEHAVQLTGSRGSRADAHAVGVGADWSRGDLGVVLKSVDEETHGGAVVDRGDVDPGVEVVLVAVVGVDPLAVAAVEPERDEPVGAEEKRVARAAAHLAHDSLGVDRKRLQPCGDGDAAVDVERVVVVNDRVVAVSVEVDGIIVDPRAPRGIAMDSAVEAQT